MRHLGLGAKDDWFMAKRSFREGLFPGVALRFFVLSRRGMVE